MGAEPSGTRTPAGAGLASSYVDPCEHTPAGTTASAVDLRELAVDDLYAADGRTLDRSQPVSFRFRLCHPMDSAAATGLRVDLHPRVDTPGGADTDYAEDPSRWLLFEPPSGTSTWTWELRDGDTGADVLDGGEAQHVGPLDAITELVADVPADLVRAAGDPSTTSATGLPPIALRACGHLGDCGPGYAATAGGGTTITSHEGLADVDYLPEPRHLAVTYPSICQHGPAPSSTGPAPSRAARVAPAQVVVDAATADQLARRGWTRLSTRPDGRAVFRGTPAAVRRIAPDARTGTVALRRPSLEPGDPYFAADGPAAPTGQWSLRRLGAPQAWGVTTGDDDVLVAVLDSGLDAAHPDLAGRAVAGRDYVQTRLTTPRPLDLTTDTDFGGHGSFVASLVAAATDDGAGMAGLGWRTRLLVARVFDAEACASDAALVDAIDWAVDRGAAAVNLSLGGPEPSEELRAAGEAALAAGTIPVAAAGNQAASAIEYPAYYDEFVSVTATGYADPAAAGEDPIARYSTRNDGVDIAAPGGSGNSDPSRDVLGACWQDPFVTRGYCRLAGTSFATPFVAGTIALARTLDPGRTVEGLRQLLDDTALDLRGCASCRPGWDPASGSGRMRTGLAVSWLGQRTETLQRVGAGSDTVAGAVAASRATFDVAGATRALVSRHDVFADALAGAPLAGGDGPILLTPTAALDDRAAAELVRILPRGATVTLLGGTEALSPQVEADVAALGYRTERVFGTTRIQTAIQIANRVVRGAGGRVLVASAANWPDAVAAGAYAAANQVPLLLTWPDSADQARSPGFLDTLASYEPIDVVVLGGTAAVSSRVTDQIAARTPSPVRRVFGPTRAETAARVVTELWGRDRAAAGDRFAVVDGWRNDSWAYGLSASPFSARNRAPLLIVAPGLAFDDPTALLHDVLRYRLPTPANGTFFGPLGGDAASQAHTLARLGELLGG